jgi:hypothetical protein
MFIKKGGTFLSKQGRNVREYVRFRLVSAGIKVDNVNGVAGGEML